MPASNAHAAGDHRHEITAGAFIAAIRPPRRAVCEIRAGVGRQSARVARSHFRIAHPAATKLVLPTTVREEYGLARCSTTKCRAADG